MVAPEPDVPEAPPADELLPPLVVPLLPDDDEDVVAASLFTPEVAPCVLLVASVLLVLDVLPLVLLLPEVVAPPVVLEAVLPAVAPEELAPAVLEGVVVWAFSVPSMSLSERDTVNVVVAVLPAPSDAIIWRSPLFAVSGTVTCATNVPELAITVLPAASSPVAAAAFMGVPSIVMVTVWPSAKPVPMMVTLSPASPLLGVAIIEALPVIWDPPAPVVAPPDVVALLPVPAVVEPVPGVVVPAPVLPLVVPEVAPPDVVVPLPAVDACPPRVKVPWIITLNESSPSISWSTTLPCTVMPVPLIVTLSVAPSAGTKFTVFENPPFEVVVVPPVIWSMREPPVELEALLPVVLPVVELLPEVVEPLVEPPAEFVWDAIV